MSGGRGEGSRTPRKTGSRGRERRGRPQGVEEGRRSTSQKPARGRTTTRKPQPGGTRRAGGGRAGERARGRAGGRRGGPAAAGGEEAGRTGRPAGKRTAGRTGGRAGGRGGRGRPVPPGAAAKGGGHDLTHGREPNQPRGVRATALPLPSHVGRRRLPHGNGQGAQAKATTKAAAQKTPLWTPIDLQG